MPKFLKILLFNFFTENCKSEAYNNFWIFFQYSEATLIAKPVIFISLQEICDTHQLLLDNVDSIAPDKKDKLRELLADLVSPFFHFKIEVFKFRNIYKLKWEIHFQRQTILGKMAGL